MSFEKLVVLIELIDLVSLVVRPQRVLMGIERVDRQHCGQKWVSRYG